MMTSSRVAKLAFILLACHSKSSTSVELRDVYLPETCDVMVNLNDHLLIDYRVIFANGTIGYAVTAPNQLLHIQLSNIEGDLPIMAKEILGSCLNSTRDFIWDNAFGADFSPFLRPNSIFSELSEQIIIRIQISHITTEDNFQIFHSLNTKNNSMTLDIIDEHRGINAVDEWGQSPLMHSVSNQNNLIFAALMNTRRPMVNVNLAKSVSCSVLYVLLVCIL